MAPPAYAPIQGPNGPLTKVFDDVWVVEGYVKISPMTFKRNMTILRCNGELLITNSVRVDDKTLKEIEALGTLKYLVKLGIGHGMDDPFYQKRYNMQIWAGAGAEWEAKFCPDGPLQASADLEAMAVSGQPLPFFPRVRVFSFEFVRAHPDKKMQSGEFALIFDQPVGPVLVVCDALHNYTSKSESEKVSELPTGCFTGCMMGMIGFKGRTVMPDMFIKIFTPNKKKEDAKADFERLLVLPWRHLIAAHGFVARDTAKEDVLAGLRTPARYGPDFMPGFLPSAGIQPTQAA
jgi:hypothetical protein